MVTKKTEWVSRFKDEVYWIAKIQNDLYSLVKEYLAKNNLEQQDLAKILGVHKSRISQIMNGRPDFKLSTLVKLYLTVGKTPFTPMDLDTYAQQSAAGVPEYELLEEYAGNLRLEETTSIDAIDINDYLQGSCNINSDNILKNVLMYKDFTNLQNKTSLAEEREDFDLTEAINLKAA